MQKDERETARPAGWDEQLAALREAREMRVADERHLMRVASMLLVAACPDAFEAVR